MFTVDLAAQPTADITCNHQPTCPSASAVDHEAARIIASHPEQGWSLRCNGVIVFDDTGELMPDGSSVAPHRGPLGTGRTVVGSRAA